jgi:hypothetical protein
MKTLTPSAQALDRLAVRAVQRHYNTYADGLQLQQRHCLALALKVVDLHNGVGRTYRKSSSVQHVLGSLTTYTRHFAPRTGWTLTDADTERNLLRWRCANRAVPDVVDVVRSNGFDDPHTQMAELATPGVVVRWCNVTEWRHSWLLFPGEPNPVAWCPADDPIHSFEWAVTA